MDKPCVFCLHHLIIKYYTTNIFQFLSIFAQNLAILPQTGGASFSRSQPNIFRISETS